METLVPTPKLIERSSGGDEAVLSTAASIVIKVNERIVRVATWTNLRGTFREIWICGMWSFGIRRIEEKVQGS